MNIVNEQIRHILFGDGKVICQEADILSIQFLEQDGVKKFLYPDAFKEYLKLHNSKIEMCVLMELRDKQARIEEEKLKKQQEYEETFKRKVSEKSKRAATKKKTPSIGKVSKQKSKSDLSVPAKMKSDEE